MLVPVVVAFSTSPAKKPLLIVTVAETRFGLLTSLTVAAGDSVAGVLDVGLALMAVLETLAATLLSTGEAGVGGGGGGGGDGEGVVTVVVAVGVTVVGIGVATIGAMVRVEIFG